MRFAQALCQRKDINLTSQNEDRYTGLTYACENGHLEVIKFIAKKVCETLGKGAFAKMLNKPSYSGTNLYLAAKNHKPKIVEFLMTFEECDHKKGNEDGWNALHMKISLFFSYGDPFGHMP